MSDEGRFPAARKAAIFTSAALGAAFLMLLGGGALAADAFKLESSLVMPGGTLANDQVFNGFGCRGKNVSPPLQWSGAPVGTKSFALTVYDPDAPTGSGWWHWIVYNIPASVTELALGAGGGERLPAGAVQARTDFGSAGYGGPCPPPGDRPHHYVFTVYALKTEKLDVPANASAAPVAFSINANKLASASITASYGR
jgi:Raf kinase inhibitor-like YbhB/YbcL family protein